MSARSSIRCMPHASSRCAITRAQRLAPVAAYSGNCGLSFQNGSTNNQPKCRSNSTASVFPLKVPITTEDDYTVLKKADLSRPENKTPELDKVVGKDWTLKAKNIHADMTKLTTELRKVFKNSSNIRAALASSDFHVRLGAHDHELRRAIAVEADEVIVAGTKIPKIWLRDNCQCSSCVHESTKQRLLDTFSIPKDLHIKNSDISKNVLSIEWSDGHESKYTQAFLSRTVRSDHNKAFTRLGLAKVALWDATIAENRPSVINDETLSIKQLLRKIRKYGFCFVDSTDHREACHTEALLESIAFLRNTHYGGFYEFTSDLASQDTAYTNIALEAHTDNTYFSDPAGLQAFHLLSHTDGEGGASLLVDGFKVAHELLEADREAYRILSTVNVHAHASGNEGISIQPYRGFPVLEHDPTTGDLLRVRWNSADRASIELPIEDVEKWYDAARKFDALLKKKENEYWEQLEPGNVLIFDNWRVLHGRSAFTGRRTICGGYINRDDWISRYKMEEFGSEKVLGSLASG